MAPAWLIRPLTGDDLDGVKALWAATDGLGVGPGDTPEAIRRFLSRNPGLSLVATVEGRIVASVLCGHVGRGGYIYRLAVALGWRRQGLAAALVKRCLAGLKDAGIPRCQVFVESGNEAAQMFWIALAGRLRDDLIVLSIDVA
jgi:ribosomal protein S18 acetylase RimI-like enzyme